MKLHYNLELYNAKRSAKKIARELDYDLSILALIDACKTVEEVSQKLTFARCAC